MLVIRQAQIEELAKAVVRCFEDRMLVHLNSYFPEHCRILEPEGSREAIRQGIKRAASYGIVGERDVCKYIDLMFALGRDFDHNPDLTWASSLLRDETMGDPSQRINLAFDQAMKYLQQAGGVAS